MHFPADVVVSCGGGVGGYVIVQPVHVKSSSGAIVEIFEWKADEAVEAAHMDNTIHGLWQVPSSLILLIKSPIESFWVCTC